MERAVSPAAALALLGVFAVAACSGGGEGQALRRAPPRSGSVVVEPRAGLDVPYVVGDRVFGLEGSPFTLATTINTNLVAMLSPAAVPAPGGHVLAYNSWRGRGPVLRLHDLGSGADRILDDGALSVAWRRDGALAYFKARTKDVTDPKRYVGYVVVRRTPDAEAVRWIPAPGRSVVAAWAGDRLLVYRVGPSWPDLLVLDGPRRERVIARAGALVAVSPDGGRAFVSIYGASPPDVRVIDIASGREVARRAVPEVGWLTESGAWAGDIVAATARDGVAVFRVGRDGVVLDQVLRFAEAGFVAGPFEPRIEGGGRRIVGWAELESRPGEALPQAAVLDCDRTSLRCRQAPAVSTGAAPRLIYNPSRP